ncbi:MAG: signal peptidase II [Rhodocyclaceae bacterium]
MSRRFALWLGVIVLTIALDQLTKLWALQAFAFEGDGFPVTSFFNLVLRYNPGAAFSFLADHSGWQRWFFTALAFGVSAWLLTMIHRHQSERLQPLAFSLVVGGAIGNVIDRIAYGKVVDFLDFHVAGHHWPAFNIADSAICVGVALMLIAQFIESRNNPHNAS